LRSSSSYRRWEQEESERRVREAERRAEVAEGRAESAEGRVELAEGRVEVAEGRVEGRVEVEGRAETATGRRLETLWAVEKEEIQLTHRELWSGAWATIHIALFRGTPVAAKSIHNVIISDFNSQLFEQEIDIAARIHHPNLMQFIGATLEGRRQLTPDLVTSIGLDVLRALNYLHLMQPHPLVHRDISSSNVLLEPLPKGRWRAKVSEYGTVNILQKLNAICPGNPCYAAPEADDPNQQSLKMDIFSFGILLLEMLAGESPDKRERLLSKIKKTVLVL
jgi:serine/threonine protein kinase